MAIDSGQNAFREPQLGRPPDELDSLVGSLVAGKYRIDRLIGRGGMGAVFQATNAAIGKRVALKFLAASTARDADAAVRFQREAEAASLAESAHIVQIFDSGRSEQGLPFLVMELLTGEDLRARLRREGRLTAASAVRLGAQVLKALRCAHAAGIIHRDLKPDNVFLCQRDDEPSFVKLVDFGISKLQQRPGVDTLTHEGAVLGTAFYMSPEQAQSFPDIDGRTDLFSVGAMLYEMLTGEPPHSGPTYEAVLIAICTREAPDVRRKAADVPDKLARVVSRALARDRTQRYQTAEELLRDLEASLGQEPALLAEAKTPSPAWTGSAQPPKSQRFQTVVLGVVAGLGGFAVAAYFATRPSGSAQELGGVPVTAAAARIPGPSSSVVPLSSPPPISLVVPSGPTPIKAAPNKGSKPSGSDKPKATSSRPGTPASPGVAGGLDLSTREP
jgi:serine/threonine protein kinase